LLSAAGSSSCSQSLIVYDHADRKTTASQHAVRRLDDLAAEVPTEPIAAAPPRAVPSGFPDGSGSWF
jgi:hypothetical protein